MKNAKELRNQVIYSIFTRNYSEEGTFAAITEEEVTRIKNLGVDIVWVMPIHPIGEKNRKGTLGSPYANQDFRSINPELGTIEDFKAVVDRIHSAGMKVIIDVVYNHTSPDSVLSKEHPEWFFKKENGDFGNKTGDWWDVIDLDYSSSHDLWEYQIESLKQWATIVDGFRCDVASLIPLEFWKEAREKVEEVRPNCIWLAESVEFSFIAMNRKQGYVGLSDSEIFEAFDMSYEYETFFKFKRYLRGESTLREYIELLNMQPQWYGVDKVKLRYLENHDNSRVAEFIKDENQLKAWTAFVYFAQGATMIFNGQEVADDHLPDLFGKDVVNWNTGKDISSYLSLLARLKKDEIYRDGFYEVDCSTEEKVIHATYTLASLSRVRHGFFPVAGMETIGVDLPNGKYKNLLDEQDVSVINGQLEVKDPIVIEA